MTPHAAPDDHSCHATTRLADEAIRALSDLETALTEEAAALDSLDFGAIERITAQKLLLEGRLDQSLGALPMTPPSTSQRSLLVDLRRRVGKQALANQARLEATLGAVKNLVNDLTLGPATTYGPRRASDPAAAAVLTSALG